VAQLLARARERGVDRLDAQLLLGHATNRPRAWLMAHDDAELTADQAAACAAFVERRAAGEPLAYIVGEKEFHGLVFLVDADVLVPRPDTETLVEWALELLHGKLSGLQPARVVDLGTGSGAIAVAVAHAWPSARMTAVDTSVAALRVARSNAERLGAAVSFLHGDWWQATGDRRFHLALSNPPYIADDDPHLGALQHEPSLALRSGADGLDAIRRIVAGAPIHLEPGGWLLLEHGHEQAVAVRQLLTAAGFDAVQSRVDLAGIARCSGGQHADRLERLWR
jgi:release factor glutamine methyltransferase